MPVVLDLGTGAFSRVRRHVGEDRLAGVVISHMHADHFIDLIPLRYALRYGERRRDATLPVYLPPGGIAMLRALVSAFAYEGGDFLGDVFELHEYDPSAPLRIGAATLRFALTEHFIPAFAMRWERDGTVMTYSADTAPSAAVTELARESDLFVCEATLRRGAREIGMRGHSSAAEAARMAHGARVRRLMLTHYGEESDAADLDDAAREAYDGEIMVADDHRIVDLR